jgi:hypothetical protein
MNATGFVVASYALTIGGVGVALVSAWLRMRRAERDR